MRTNAEWQAILAEAQARFSALPPEEQRRQREAQRQSWVRGMTAQCEHGVVDFEQCPDCRRAALERLEKSAALEPKQRVCPVCLQGAGKWMRCNRADCTDGRNLIPEPTA